MELFGDVYIGERSFVAGNTVLRAVPDRRLDIGSETNAQDNIIVRSLEDSYTLGNETSLAHQAIVRDSTVGDSAFLGFDAEIIDSTIEDGALISAGAFIENVTIPEDALVSPGAQITTQEQADALENVTKANEEFKREVLDANAELGEFVPIVGNVRLGSGSRVGERVAIRADEGSPITIGEDAEIEERVTFHALKDTNIEVGDNLTVGDDSVIHGPIEIGDSLTVGDDSVVFRVRVGDDVGIGDDVTIQGTVGEDGELELEIPYGTNIPDDAVVTNQEELDAIIEQQGQQQGQGE